MNLINFLVNLLFLFITNPYTLNSQINKQPTP